MNEDELSAVLHRVAEDAGGSTGPLPHIRRRAQQIRRRRVAFGSTVAAASLASAFVVPALLAQADTPAPIVAHVGMPTSTMPPPRHCQGMGCSPRSAPAVLYRPVRLPHVAPGQPCPVSGSLTLAGAPGFSGPVRVVGRGPFYLAGNGRVLVERSG
ncbi:MAG: hypothetical protein QOI51_1760, partial [Nocardioidaceae bacterium]|nr:hypothetical protein [Nocardioidaceae bacterium]